MVRLSTVRDQVGGSASFQAPGVAPVQDQTGRQIQQAGQGLEQAGRGIARLGDEIQLSVDTARVTESDTILGEFVRNQLNTQDGYRSKQGRSAVDESEQIAQTIVDKRNQIAGDLTTKEQRSEFERVSNARVAQAQGVIDAHAGRQGMIYEVSQVKAGVDNHAADYLDNLGNPRAAARSLELVRRGIDEFARLAGVGGEEHKKLVRERMTQLHSDAITSLVSNGDAEGARDYMSSYGEAMSKPARDQSRAVVGKAMAFHNAGEVARVVTGKVSAVTDEPLDGGDSVLFSDIAGRARGIQQDQQRQQEARERTPREFLIAAASDIAARVDAGTITKEVGDIAYDQVQTEYKAKREVWVAESGELVQTAEQMLRDNPNAGVGNLPPGMQQELERRGLLGDMYTFVESNRRHTTDPAVLEVLMNQTREEWGMRSERDWRLSLNGKLSPRGMDTAIAQYKSQTKEAAPADRRYLSNQKRFERLGRELGKLPESGAPDYDEQQEFDEWFEDFVEPKLIQQQERLKRDLDDGEVQAILKEIRQEELQIESGGFFGGVRLQPLITANTDEMGEVFHTVNGERIYLREVETVAQEIGNMLREAGKPANAAAIIEKYAGMSQIIGRPPTMADLRVPPGEDEVPDLQPPPLDDIPSSETLSGIGRAQSWPTGAPKLKRPIGGLR